MPHPNRSSFIFMAGWPAFTVGVSEQLQWIASLRTFIRGQAPELVE
jgi:hypothetical protein